MSGDTNTNFLQDIERFMREYGLSATRFGVLAAGDTKFVTSIRKGRRCREATITAVRVWMKTAEST